MSEVVIEPVGGFTGGSMGALKSEGRVPLASLSAGDRAAIDSMMAAPDTGAANFGYRVTVRGPDGEVTRQVAADDVPAALVDSIKTEFR